MRGLTFLFSVLALLCAGAVAVFVTMPDRLPAQLAAYAPAARDNGRVDRLTAEVEQLRQTVQQQDKTAAELRTQQQRLSDQIAGLQAQVQQLQARADTETTGSVRKPVARRPQRRSR